MRRPPFGWAPLYLYGRSEDGLGMWHFCGSNGWCYIDWLDHWQTMITGVLAVGAAAWAASIARGQLSAAKDQLTEQRAQEQRARGARLRAARATLPAALSAVCGYAKETADAVRAHMAATDAARMLGDRPSGMPPVQFPSEALSVLERIIEFVDRGEIAVRIESILREAQVLDVRFRDRVVLGAFDAPSFMLQAASIYARAESLFEYARNQSDTVDIADLWDRTFVAFRLFGLHGARWDDVRTFAQRSRDRGDMPGEADDRPGE